jgi:hypothetical protein
LDFRISVVDDVIVFSFASWCCCFAWGETMAAPGDALRGDVEDADDGDRVSVWNDRKSSW